MLNKTTEFVLNNPGCTAKSMSEARGINQATAGSYLLNEYKRGRARREIARMSASNTPIYAYFPADSKSKPRALPHKPRVLSQAKVKTGQSFDDMIDGIAKSLASQIVSRINGHMAFEMARMTTGIGINEIIAPAPGKREETALALPTPAEIAIRITEQPKEKKISKPSALVVGLLPIQAGIIQRDFGDAYTLEFWKDDGVDRLRALSKQADIVFLHINHMSHPTEAAIRKHNKNCIRVGGGLSNLKVEMSNWYGQEWHK